MPVRESSILAAHASTRQEVHSLDFGAKRHLETRTDRAVVLGDILPVRPSREVLSFGDLILAFGVADVIFRLLRPVEARRHHGDVIDVSDAAVAPEPAPRPQAHLVDA
jgi:hypothetical protein